MNSVKEFENAEDLNRWLGEFQNRKYIIKKIFSRPDHSFFVWCSNIE